MHELCLSEYGMLTQQDVVRDDLQVRWLQNPQAWALLEGYAYSSEKEHRFVQVASYHGIKALRVVNFVGLLTTPDGTQIEILPKTSEHGQDVAQTRALLWKMLSVVEDLTFLASTEAQLMLRNMPLPEALISIFLQQAATLIRRGLRRDYERIEAEEPFLRGRLRVSSQMRQPPGRQHLFQIEYDVHSANRAENRLLHAAIILAGKWSKAPGNQRLARELRSAMDQVPVSQDFALDFTRWQDTRDMAHYRPVLPWIRLILNRQSPYTLKDQHHGISFLFPMETLFEKYVAVVLSKQAQAHGLHLKTQLANRCLSDSPAAFLLKPDLALYQGSRLLAILDTKWKLIDQDTRYDNGDPDPKAGISQADMYQLFAYGHKYLSGAGKLVLIYPQWRGFSSPLPTFTLGPGLMLETVPFDLCDDGNPAIGALLRDIAGQAAA
jgi:5-methylcytosine-specific restriction enzyme subunit McrC